MTSNVNATVGARIASLRKARRLTQDQLATMVGVEHGQIVSSIEHGQRSLKVSELSRFASALCVPFLSLLPVDPLPEQPRVRWRQVRDEDARALDEALFVDRCRRYAFVERVTGTTPARDLRSFPLDIASTSYEHASSWAERVRGELRLGELPAPALRDTLESTVGIKVFVTPLKGGSGAATNGAYGMAVLVNKDEPPDRQAYSLAHELFHLLTWASLPPDATALAPEMEKRNEQLADAFASALLLPAEPLLQRLGAEPVEGRRLIVLERLARDFGVSLPALVYRLVNLGRLHKDVAQKILDAPDRWRTRPGSGESGIPDFPSRYVALAFTAYVDGEISIGKLAELLETTVGMLPRTLLAYGFDPDTDAYETQVLSA